MLKNLFSSSPSSKAEYIKARESDPARARVSHYSRGNVNLQRGNYVTHAEKEARKKAIFGYSFSS